MLVENNNDSNNIKESNEHRIRKVTWVGMIVNILLSFIKIIAGQYGRSQAVLADGIHSLSDTATDIAVIAGSYFWSKPPDNSHPYGHQRLETIVSIFIGVVLLLAGAGIGIEAMFTLHEKHNSPPGWVALLAATLSIFSKEILYQWTAATGKQINSLALSANAWHHRLDAISSIPVLIAVGISILWPSWNFIDHIGAFIVSLMILYAAVKIIFTAFKELLDGGAPREICEQIKTIALTNESVHQVHDIRTRYSGNCLHVDLHVVVDGSMTVHESHKITEEIETSILSDGPDVIDVVTHIEPMESAVSEDQCNFNHKRNLPNNLTAIY